MKFLTKSAMNYSTLLSVIAVMLFLPGLATAAKDYSSKKYPTNLAPSADLRYAVQADRSGLSIDGEADMNWQVIGSSPNQTYRIKTETRAPIFGKILAANSVGDINTFGLAPYKYEETQRKKPTYQTIFNQKTRKITFSDSSATYPLNGGEQDRTSAIWQLVSIARGSPKKFIPKSQWSFFVAGRRDAEEWTFSVDEKVTLPTSFGALSAVHVSKQAGDQRIDIWLAPTMEWYPVRIKYRDANGDTIEQNLAHVNKLSEK